MKIYLAGPDVFRENAVDYLNGLKELCIKYGFIGLAPLDNIIVIDSDKSNTPFHSNLIFSANVELIKECDIIIANILPFRGACIDDGTAWEIGYGFALGKKIYGYSTYMNKTLEYTTNKMYDISKQPEFPIIENFMNSCNLMIEDSIRQSGGVVCNTFEDCLLMLSKTA